MKNNTLVLVDGSYYMFRAYHGMPPLYNSQGEPTGAIFGTVNMLRKLCKEHPSDHLAVIFDAHGKNFRNDLYPDYKAHRPPTPDELISQITPIHELIKALGIPLLIIDDVEADDVIGTLATKASQQNLQILISSGDKDLAQLVNDNIRMINTISNDILDHEGVKKKYGVPPSSIIDYLALTGDSVDNVPGIPKVGPKTAVKWLKEYHSLDNIVQHADQIKGKVGENLRANLQQLELSKRLVTLKLDVELPYELEQLKCIEPDKETLRKAYQRWQFKNWLADLDKPNSIKTVPQPKPKPVTVIASTPAVEPPQLSDTDTSGYQTILTLPDLQHWIEKLRQSNIFALDTETTSLQHMDAKLVGISFATAAGEAAYIPIAHDYLGAPKQLSRQLVLDHLRPLLEDPKQAKLGQNIKYDKNVLANYDIKLMGIAHDSMLQSYILDSTNRHDLDSLATNHLQKNTIHYKDLTKVDGKEITFDKVNIEQATPYAAEDADITLQLHQNLWHRLQQEEKLSRVYTELEIPLLSVLSQIERNGVMIDAPMLERQSRVLGSLIGDLEQQIYDMAQQKFNIASTQQVQKVLYEDQGLPVLAKTPKGQPSTSESVLRELAHEHQLPQLILEYRGLNKLKNTYTDKLPQQIHLITGRVHSSYHQAVTSTGRLSCSDPNLQNIPIRTAHGRCIRQAFTAPPDHLLMTADYSQIELRIMAHLSKDQGLLDAFNKGQDIHNRTAAEIFSTSTEMVTTAQRRTAKAINFGLIYGMSAFGLAKQLEISRSQAKDYVEHYFACYPGIKNYMETIRLQARERGYVETVAGRRLYIPEINARHAARRQYAERTAINAPMQGTAADIIKRAMIDIAAWLNQNHPEVKLIMQVHDELVFEVPQQKAVVLATEIRHIMSNAAELSIPLTVDIGSGKDWDTAH